MTENKHSGDAGVADLASETSKIQASQGEVPRDIVTDKVADSASDVTATAVVPPASASTKPAAEATQAQGATDDGGRGDSSRTMGKTGLLDRKFEDVTSGEPELPPKVLNRIAAVFVPSDGLQGECERLRSRVVAVCGEPGTGRFTAAVWLGQRLLREQPKSRIVPLTLNTLAGSLLLDWIRSDERQKNTVYVFQQTRSLGFALETEDLARIERELWKLNSWLILTATPQEVQSLGEPARKLSLRSLDSDQLVDVMNKHLHWLEQCEPEWDLGPARSQVLNRVESLIRARAFVSPSQIAQLLGRLPELQRKGFPDSDEKLEAALKSLGKEVAGEVMQSWFDGLSRNAQFLALLVEALRGIRRAEVEEIYCRESLRLRAEGGLVLDPRRFGFDDLFRSINAQTTGRVISMGRGKQLEIQLLEFAHESYRREVVRQMRSRHHLLWGVVESMIATGLKAVAEPWQAPQRQLLGEVIARLGIPRPDDLRVVLEQLARDASGIIASVPGYILRGVCLLDEPDYHFVRDVLEGWVRSDDLVWAAVAAIWRVYTEVGRHRAQLAEGDSRGASMDRMLDQLEALVTRVADAELLSPAPKPADDFVSYAVVRMFHELPDRMARMLRQWLAGNERLAAAGARVIHALFDGNADVESLTAPRLQALLSLLGAVLRLDREIVDDVLEVLLGWLTSLEPAGNDQGPDSTWEEPRRQGQEIGQAVLAACNRTRAPERNLLRRSLTSMWLRSHASMARTIAQTVIGRARLLDGAPTDLPGAGSAALVIDASEAGPHNDTAFRLTQELFEFLRPQVDLWVVQLGNKTPLALPGKGLDAERLPARPPATRLLMPWVEQWLGETDETARAHRLHFMFVVHRNELVDTEDVEALADLPFLPLRVPFYYLDEESSAPARGITVEVPVALQPFAHDLQHLFQKVLSKLDQDKRRAENERRSMYFLSVADLALLPCLAHALAGRSPESWWDLLAAPITRIAGHAPHAGDRFTGATEVLDVLVNRLDEFDADPNTSDPMRIAMSLVQWMAAKDLGLTVGRLSDWMRLGPRDPRGGFAAAAAIMLLRIRFACMLPAPGATAQAAPPATLFAPLLELAPALARHRSELGILVLLTALRCWAGDPAWAKALRSRPALLRMVDANPAWLCEQVSERLSAWTAGPIDALGEKQVPESVHASSLRLKCALATRLAGRVTLGPTVLILCHPSGHRGSRLRLGELAWRLYELAESQRKRHPHLPRFMFFQAGKRHPVAVSGDALTREEFQMDSVTSGLVAPLLEYLLAPLHSGDGQAAAVDLTVLLADGPFVDGGDWFESTGSVFEDFHRTGRLQLFWDNHQIAPPSTEPAWHPLHQIESLDAAFRLVVKHLKTRLEVNNL